MLVILGDALEQAQSYAGLVKLPFKVLADPQRSIYHQFGLQKAFPGIQRTASVMIDKDGIIRSLKRTTNPMLWLQESKEILAAAQVLAQAGR